ncbi:uncharacterized protein PADG_11593 [Paracoccidioides brasiliensis Pb18]|uniref:Uncharacterized protein n=1 Tax=Paracoccidioides brasiliensis (strain Pb18) TaxID=502780 RepID=A0A0A0HUV4_PARBD|nr:uncharacterized protein PADG_11593 [Paracoccidioides brasiliensis Pb18]KGM92392.1 hypothetical protein PADG_11593 [Paracoccidioides brasiliensis Pb18]ODH49015.1 hypothetical protein GX48_04840 [Paracoccidioides brasiliensis]
MTTLVSKFTELLDLDTLQQHTFTDADVRLEDILAAEAVAAERLSAASSPTRIVSRSRSPVSASSLSTSSFSSSSIKESLGARMKLPSPTRLTFRSFAFPSR